MKIDTEKFLAELNKLQNEPPLKFSERTAELALQFLDQTKKLVEEFGEAWIFACNNGIFRDRATHGQYIDDLNWIKPQLKNLANGAIQNTVVHDTYPPRQLVDDAVRKQYRSVFAKYL
jgi:hypothetical protein